MSPGCAAIVPLQAEKAAQDILHSVGRRDEADNGPMIRQDVANLQRHVNRDRSNTGKTFEDIPIGK
jgi:hypothetical protein